MAVMMMNLFANMAAQNQQQNQQQSQVERNGLQNPPQNPRQHQLRNDSGGGDGVELDEAAGSHANGDGVGGHSLVVGGQLSAFQPISSAVGYNKVSYPAPPADLKAVTDAISDAMSRIAGLERTVANQQDALDAAKEERALLAGSRPGRGGVDWGNGGGGNQHQPTLQTELSKQFREMAARVVALEAAADAADRRVAESRDVASVATARADQLSQQISILRNDFGGIVTKARDAAEEASDRAVTSAMKRIDPYRADHLPADKQRWMEDAAVLAKEEWTAALADHRAKASEAAVAVADRLRGETEAAEVRSRMVAESAAAVVRAELVPRLERALQRGVAAVEDAAAARRDAVTAKEQAQRVESALEAAEGVASRAAHHAAAQISAACAAGEAAADRASERNQRELRDALRSTQAAQDRVETTLRASAESAATQAASGAQERAVAAAARALKEVQAADRVDRVSEQEAITSALNEAVAKLDKSTAARVHEVRSIATSAQEGVQRLDVALRERRSKDVEDAAAATRAGLRATAVEEKVFAMEAHVTYARRAAEAAGADARSARDDAAAVGTAVASAAASAAAAVVAAASAAAAEGKGRELVEAARSVAHDAEVRSRDAAAAATSHATAVDASIGVQLNAIKSHIAETEENLQSRAALVECAVADTVDAVAEQLSGFKKEIRERTDAMEAITERAAAVADQCKASVGVATASADRCLVAADDAAAAAAEAATTSRGMAAAANAAVSAAEACKAQAVASRHAAEGAVGVAVAAVKDSDAFTEAMRIELEGVSTSVTAAKLSAAAALYSSSEAVAALRQTVKDAISELGHDTADMTSTARAQRMAFQRAHDAARMDRRNASAALKRAEDVEKKVLAAAERRTAQMAIDANARRNEAQRTKTSGSVVRDSTRGAFGGPRATMVSRDTAWGANIRGSFNEARVPNSRDAVRVNSYGFQRVTSLKQPVAQVAPSAPLAASVAASTRGPDASTKATCTSRTFQSPDVSASDGACVDSSKVEETDPVERQLLRGDEETPAERQLLRGDEETPAERQLRYVSTALRERSAEVETLRLQLADAKSKSLQGGGIRVKVRDGDYDGYEDGDVIDVNSLGRNADSCEDFGGGEGSVSGCREIAHRVGGTASVVGMRKGGDSDGGSADIACRGDDIAGIGGVTAVGGIADKGQESLGARGGDIRSRGKAVGVEVGDAGGVDNTAVSSDIEIASDVSGSDHTSSSVKDRGCQKDQRQSEDATGIDPGP
jgi:hypothetical protein